MRDITKVIDRMLEHIPEEAVDLRQRLGKIRKDALYTAPEDMARRWAAARVALVDHFGLGDNLEELDLPDWGHKVGRILAGRKEPRPTKHQARVDRFNRGHKTGDEVLVWFGRPSGSAGVKATTLSSARLNKAGIPAVTVGIRYGHARSGEVVEIPLSNVA